VNCRGERRRDKPVPPRARDDGWGGCQNRVVASLLRLLVGCSVLLVAGCGNSRTPVPDASVPAAPAGFRTLRLTHAAVSLVTPRNWTVTGQSAPLVLTLNSGPAVVALWRFARAAPPPASGADLASTRTALIKAVRTRDRTLTLLSSRLVRIDGARAVQLQARERIGGQLRRVSSTHVYVSGAELVLDEYAPPAQFATVERSVFAPIRRSLALLPAGGA
jgi:hypothetical protein